MNPSKPQTEPSGAGPTEREMPCPALSRFWDVALGGTWTSSERQHVASCSQCRVTERTIAAAVGGRLSDERDFEPLSGQASEMNARIDASDRGSEAVPDLRSETERDQSLLTRTPPDHIAAIDLFTMTWTAALDHPRTEDNSRPETETTAISADLEAPRTADRWESSVERAGRDEVLTRECSEPPRELVGNYQILSVIGQGGMGTVFAVRDVALGRVVALKTFRRFGISDSAAMDRFFRAARITARLAHPSIVPIYDVGQVDGTPYIVSRLIEGKDLAALTRQMGRFPPGDAARITREVANALHYAHEHGVIHRDVKPSNIVIDVAGHAMLTDFGLARSVATDDEASVTIEGTIIGTPAYMSPEQAEGQLVAMGPASDIYSLGATLYSLLVGRGPFSGQSVMETIRLAREVEPTPPRRLDPTVPRDLEAICLKAMNKVPKSRYSSARAMAEDLERFLDGRPTDARRPGAAERLARWLRRRPARSAVVLLAFASLVLVAYQQFELRKARERLVAEDRRELRLAISRSDEPKLRTDVELGERRIRGHSGNHEERRVLASSYHRLGDLLVNTDRLAEASWAYERAVTLLRQHLQDEGGDVVARIELADVLGNLGETYLALDRTRDARATYRDALIVRQKLVADHPDVPSYQDDLKRTQYRWFPVESVPGNLE